MSAGSISIIKELDKQVVKIYVNQSLPLLRYYQMSSDCHIQAQAYELEDQLERSYVMYKRFVLLFLNTITQHKDYKLKQYENNKSQYNKLCHQALDKLEIIKKQICEKYENGYEEEEEAQSQQTTHSSLLSANNTSPNPEINPNNGTNQIAKDLSTLSVNPASLSTPVKAQSWANLRLSPPIQPPNQAAPSPINPQAINNFAPQSALPGISPPFQTAAAPSSVSAPIYPSSFIHNASAPPAPAPQAAAPLARPRKKIDFSHTMQLRRIHIPQSLMDDFMFNYAARNTQNNLETCGILTGKVQNNELYISHVIIPHQTGTSDTCVTCDEEELINIQLEKDLLTLGWIHTHPSQSCFLSSIDLHTHYSYQLMLNESIAIVLAPTATPNSGIFHCTQLGMSELSQCNFTGFHKHNTTEPLFAQANHWVYDNNIKATFIDIRSH
jgi:STAM-binding protein